MGQRLATRCGIFRAARIRIFFSKRLVTGVHELLHFWRTYLFQLRSDEHGSHLLQLQIFLVQRPSKYLSIRHTVRTETRGRACSSLRPRPTNQTGSQPSWRSTSAGDQDMSRAVDIVRCSRNKRSCIGCSYPSKSCGSAWDDSETSAILLTTGTTGA